MQQSAVPCSMQACQLHASNKTQSCWLDLKFRQYLWADIHKLLLYSFKKTIIWINFKENVLLQPVAESWAWCLLLLLTIVWKQRGRVHTCSHGIKRLTGGLFLTLMFIPSSASSPQATENTVDYLIVLYTDGRLQFHCHFMIQSWESYLSAEKDGEGVRRRHHSLLYTVCFTRYSVLRCTQVTGQDNLPVHIKSRSADKLVRAWPEIALIYGVITEFCCSIDMPGCLCFGSCVWLITMKLSGLRGKQTGLMLLVVWCVWWHISCSNHKSYRHVILHCSLQYVCASRLRE